ncbi:circadian clock protein LdpA [Crocosphaera sp. Alani8]|uniref:circadian clock protein LdpA n=1 Tax=Crocosphaera sp. Alani8 TaxID=3038952 RepID=UPI00313E0411
MNDWLSPSASLRKGKWFKLICGASFQDLPAIRSLSLVYTLAGANCIDVAADPAVIKAAREGINLGIEWGKIAKNRGYPQMNKPWLMVSLNDGKDPHFRKAYFDEKLCPSDCLRPCESICPAQAIVPLGIIEQRCYGCGRCLPVCPLNLIETRSRTITPETILDLLKENSVDAIEIHTQVGREKLFKELWQQLSPGIKQLKLVAISCPDGKGLINYLHTLYDIVSPLSCELIWQTDGRPMSGDIGKGTTHAAIRLGKKVLAGDLPGWVQLAGGTNNHTVPKLKELGLLAPKSLSEPTIAGIAYGSYARTLISPFLEAIETQIRSSPTKDVPESFWQAVDTAYGLVSPLKQR